MPHEPGNRAMTRWGYSELLLGQPATDEVLQQGSLVGKYRCGMHASMVTKEQVPGIHIGLRLGHFSAIRHRPMDWRRRRLSCTGSGSTEWMPPSIARSRRADVCPPTRMVLDPRSRRERWLRAIDQSPRCQQTHD